MKFNHDLSWFSKLNRAVVNCNVANVDSSSQGVCDGQAIQLLVEVIVLNAAVRSRVRVDLPGTGLLETNRVEDIANAYLDSGPINKRADSVFVIRHHDNVKADAITFVAIEAALNVH